MKTIAITVDEETLARVDEIASSAPDRFASRSALVREALAEYVAREQRRDEERSERKVLHRHRARLNQELAALVREQARR